MTGAGIEGIDRTVHATNGWIHDIIERLGWDNRAKSYRLLRSVLHALRDWPPISEGANLSAQLPTLPAASITSNGAPRRCRPSSATRTRLHRASGTA